MTFYNEKEQLYLEIDASGVGLGASLLELRDGMWFARNEVPDNAVIWPTAFAGKSLISAETWYSYIEEVLGILHGLEKSNNYCFTCKVSVITDHKLLVAIFKEM